MFSIKSCNAFVQPAFSWREIAQEMAWALSSRSSILTIAICDRSAHQLLVNCFEKFVMQTNNCGFNSTYMFACK